MFYHRDILSILEKLDPDTVLAIFPRAEQALMDYVRSHENTQIDYARDDVLEQQFNPGKRYRVTVIAETLEHMPKREAETLLSRLRDLHSEILYVIVPIGTEWKDHESTWRHADMLALAFRLAGSYEVDNKPCKLYHYDIYNYKHTPDWLNSRYWANPDMWDKARW